jgi:hypothetical protein
VSANGVGQNVLVRSFSDPLSNKVGCECPQVVMLGDAGPVLAEDSSAPRVNFNESDGFISTPFRGKRKATYTTA